MSAEVAGAGREAGLADGIAPLLLRCFLLVLAAILSIAAVWLLLAEFSRPGISALPADPGSAAQVTASRASAFRAASLGWVRGDLWAECAFAHADLYWSPVPSSDASAVEEGRRCAVEAVRHGPYQPGVWLLLAGLASRYRWSDVSPAEALKMSYYTGPDEPALTPMRLSVAASSGALADEDLKGLVRADVESIVSRRENLRGAVKAAYRQASPETRTFFAEVVGKLDPAFAASLSAPSP